MGTAPWRPPQWSQNNPVPVIINFPGVGSGPQFTQDSAVTAVLPIGPTLYVFDAVLELDHEQRLELTKHPVQSGASISDHAYVVPATLVCEIGMSDVMDAYYSPSTWTGNASKSVSAYQTLLAIAFARIPFSITTKLRTYNNMILTVTTARDTSKTIFGLRATLTFEQIFIASVTTTAVSARPQSTNTTGQGTLNPQPPSSTQADQNSTASISPATLPVLGVDALNPGNWSSSPTSVLGNLPGPK